MNRVRVLAALGLGLAAGCALPAAYVPVPEACRLPSRLPAFVAGQTSFARAAAQLRAVGVTNLAAAEGELPGGARGLLRALTGDRLNRVYFFEADRFARAVPLQAHPGSDVALSLKAVVVAGRSAAMVIGSELADARGRLGVIVVPNDDSGETATIPLLRGDGPRLPLVLGSSLDLGVFLTARDARGQAWYDAVPIRFERGVLRVGAPVSAQRLLSCGCARDWYFEPRRWLAAERRALGL